MPRQFKTTKSQLEALRVTPSKARGQNFLIEPGAIDMILQFGRPDSREQVLEIGPGLGALTGELSRLGPLTVIEIEESFCDELERRFTNLTIVNEDVRFVDFGELGESLTVFGNLPYSYSTDILFHLIENRAHIKRAILLLQKEFVQRLAGKPGTKAYGTLSIACQLYAKVKPGPVITGDCFHPPAKVDSQVVELQFYDDMPVKVDSQFWMRRIVAAAFFRRRKKILNSIKASGTFPGVDFEPLLKLAGIDRECRAESLTVAQFAALANAYTTHIGDTSPEGSHE